jgi:hypothetical protein
MARIAALASSRLSTRIGLHEASVVARMVTFSSALMVERSSGSEGSLPSAVAPRLT